jgi:hypothetical protein
MVTGFSMRFLRSVEIRRKTTEFPQRFDRKKRCEVTDAAPPLPPFFRRSWRTAATPLDEENAALRLSRARAEDE